MWTLLDRYLFKSYLKAFAFAVLIFTMISVVIDFANKLDDFQEEDIGIWQIFSEYYINFIPYINILLWPMYALITVVFFTSRLANTSQFIPVLNAGFSFRRFLVPFLMAATVLAGIHVVAAHYVVPNGNKERIKFENTYVWKHDGTSQTNNIHRYTDFPSTKIYMRFYRLKDSIGNDFLLEEHDGRQITRKLFARQIRWKERPNQWTLQDFVDRRIDGLDETLRRGVLLDTIFDFTPEDFYRRENLKETLNSFELLDFISKERERGASNFRLYEVEYHRRWADPFVLFILTIIGVAVAARKVRGGIGIHLAIGALIGALYVFFSRFGTQFAIAYDDYPVWLGVWIPNIIFTGVALIMMRFAQK